MTRCTQCGAEVPPDEPGSERQPCPSCGSLARTHEASLTTEIKVTGSASAQVERGINEARMTALVLIFPLAVGVGLTIGFETCALLGVLAGIAAALATAGLVAAVYRIPGITHGVMTLMHWITGK